jgi:hypothetical protein
MELTRIESTNLTEEEKQKMFDMYVLSYTLGGQDLWFKKKEELFERYPCVITFDNKYLTVYAMFQFRKNYNKISLICHNGSDEGKKLTIELLLKLVNMSGWILEAADKVSWLLRKNKAPIISNLDDINKALDIVGSKIDVVNVNKDFNYDDKMSYLYTRSYHDLKSGKTYHSNETLFGTKGCLYDDNGCQRKCLPSKLGGKRIKNKTVKKSTRKSKHFKLRNKNKK